MSSDETYSRRIDTRVKHTLDHFIRDFWTQREALVRDAPAAPTAIFDELLARALLAKCGGKQERRDFYETVKGCQLAFQMLKRKRRLRVIPGGKF